jgi:hypothetical protein
MELLLNINLPVLLLQLKIKKYILKGYKTNEKHFSRKHASFRSKEFKPR